MARPKGKGTLPTIKEMPKGRVTPENAAQRGREIVFLKYYLWKWMDSWEINYGTQRRLAIALATLAGCPAKPVEEMMELKNISWKPTEDIRWKTEHNIYPHYITKAEEVYCLYKAMVPATIYSQMKMLDMDKNRGHQHFAMRQQEPLWYSKPYYYGTVLHEEHWEAIEKIMYFVTKIIESTPANNWWRFDGEFYKQMETRANGKDNSTTDTQ